MQSKVRGTVGNKLNSDACEVGPAQNDVGLSWAELSFG